MQGTSYAVHHLKLVGVLNVLTLGHWLDTVKLFYRLSIHPLFGLKMASDVWWERGNNKRKLDSTNVRNCVYIEQALLFG